MQQVINLHIMDNWALKLLFIFNYFAKFHRKIQGLHKIFYFCFSGDNVEQEISATERQLERSRLDLILPISTEQWLLLRGIKLLILILSLVYLGWNFCFHWPWFYYLDSIIASSLALRVQLDGVHHLWFLLRWVLGRDCHGGIYIDVRAVRFLMCPGLACLLHASRTKR